MTCLQLDLNATAADSRTQDSRQQAACHEIIDVFQYVNKSNLDLAGV